MKCKFCRNGYYNFYDDGDEIICSKCGASYCLKYLGYYPEGSNKRIDEGFEERAWLDKYAKKEKKVMSNED